MNIETAKAKLSKAYEQMQKLTIQSNRETMTTLLAAMINVQEAYKALQEGAEPDDH